jgi:hypothetical protein
MRPLISAAFRRGANSQYNQDGVYILVTVTHTEVAETYYLTDAPEIVTSRGIPFLPIPMEPTISEDSPDRAPQAKLLIANIDRRLVTILRSTNIAADIKLEVVKISDPDYVEAILDNFKMKDVTYDAMTIEGTLSLEELFSEPFSDYNFTPQTAPGLFF